MPEKRKLKRRQLIYYLRVLDRDSEMLIGRLVDITTEGVMLLSESPLKLDKLFKFKMILPPHFKAQKIITFDAKCLWSKIDVNPDLYTSGFQFDRISPQDIYLIEELILDYELPTP